jgi:TRAP-type transport system small permease protein
LRPGPGAGPAAGETRFAGNDPMSADDRDQPDRKQPDQENPWARPAKLADVVFVRIPYILTGTLFFIAVAINFVNVIARYFFLEAIYWAEDVLVYLMVWGVMLAAASITYQGLHIKMDLFSATFRSPFKEIVNAFIAAFMILATLYVIIQSYAVISLYVHTGEVGITAGIPLVIPHSAIPVGFGLMAIAVVVRLRCYITGRFE